MVKGGLVCWRHLLVTRLWNESRERIVQAVRQVSRVTASSYKTQQERAVTSRTGQGSEAVALSVQQGARHVDAGLATPQAAGGSRDSR